MKSQSRIIGIDDAAFRRDDKTVNIIGVLFRGGDFLDGVLSTTVQKDGDDATHRISDMIISSRFRHIKAILLDGIAVGGFNVIDIEALCSSTGVPVIVVMRKLPRLKKMKHALKKLNMVHKIDLLNRAGTIETFNNIYFQYKGIEADEAKEILSLTCTHASLPEPIRVAHLIGSGLAFGESRGGA